jgi:hypothetical protein
VIADASAPAADVVSEQELAALTLVAALERQAGISPSAPDPEVVEAEQLRLPLGHVVDARWGWPRIGTAVRRSRPRQVPGPTTAEVVG